MLTKKWFLMFDGQVQGPLDETQIENILLTRGKSLIWGRGLSEWLNANEWRAEKDKLKAQSQLEKKEVQWKYRSPQGTESPFSSYEELLEKFKSLHSLNGIEVWNSQSKAWQDVFSNSLLADDLGVTRRRHPRVPILGHLVLENPKVPQMNKYRVISVSEGGLGLAEAVNLTVGDRFRGTFTSPSLFLSVPCDCEVVYAAGDKSVGVRFFDLTPEFRGVIVEYVNKFAEINS